MRSLQKKKVIKNHPKFWKKYIPTPRFEDHKYSRGALFILGGKELTGAARLAARAAQRVGAGIVSLVCEEKIKAVYQASLETVVIRSFVDMSECIELLSDERYQTVLLGCGLLEAKKYEEVVRYVLETKKHVIFDASTLVSTRREVLFGQNFSTETSSKVYKDVKDPLLSQRATVQTILTPHAQEFQALFPELDLSTPEVAISQAAKISNAVVLLKGAHSLIAHPDGTVYVNTESSPYLATAGTGDVLAGMIAGLVACGVPAFEAVAMAVWYHGALAKKIGQGLIAEDLVAQPFKLS